MSGSYAPVCTFGLGIGWWWGLALGGQAGVEQVLRGLLAELDLTLALSGYTGVGQVDRDALLHSI